MKLPLHEDRARYDYWLQLILFGIPLILLTVGIILIPEDREGAIAMFGGSLFVVFLFYLVLPKKYQIFEDKLKILLGWPLYVDISLTNISDSRITSGSKVFAYWGIRFATSTKSVVEIIRKRGLNIVISPSNGPLFVDRLNEACKQQQITES
jgi:hypothetical protein